MVLTALSGYSSMSDKFDSTIRGIVEEFDSTPTTVDPRTGIDRRCKDAKEFPIVDSKGNVVAKDRRCKERRSKKIDIDDISDYEHEIH